MNNKNKFFKFMYKLVYTPLMTSYEKILVIIFNILLSVVTLILIYLRLRKYEGSESVDDVFPVYFFFYGILFYFYFFIKLLLYIIILIKNKNKKYYLIEKYKKFSNFWTKAYLIYVIYLIKFNSFHLLINICFLIIKKYPYIMYFFFYQMPLLIMAEIFFLDLHFFNELHYFYQNLWLFLLPLVYKIIIYTLFCYSYYYLKILKEKKTNLQYWQYLEKMLSSYLDVKLNFEKLKITFLFKQVTLLFYFFSWSYIFFLQYLKYFVFPCILF